MSMLTRDKCWTCLGPYSMPDSPGYRPTATHDSCGPVCGHVADQPLEKHFRIRTGLTNVTTHKSCACLPACSGSLRRALTSSRNAFVTSSTWSARLILPWRRKRIATGFGGTISLVFDESASSRAKTLSVMPAMTVVRFRVDMGGYVKFVDGRGRGS